MRSIYAITEEFDVENAAEEIVAEIIGQVPLQKNTVGILYYDYEMQGAELCGRLREMLGIDILGCATIATVNNDTGYRDMSAVLTLLTAEDCEFCVGVTEALTDENTVNEIHGAFVQMKCSTKLDPKLVFAFLPCGTGIIFDKYIDDLSKKADYVPIIGGIPTNQGAMGNTIVFNGACYESAAVILLISGNVDPIISLANVVETLSDRKETVTKAEGTAIHEVGGKSFAEYIESYGMNIRDFDKNESRIFFQKYPLLIDTTLPDTDAEVPYVRIVESMDWKDGSGIAYASIPEGAKLSLAILRKEDITKTVEKGMNELFRKIEQSKREYSVILCITCAARHFILNPYYEIEGNLIKDLVPESYRLSGFYGYGELCPTRIEDGKASNQLHNGSIVFCAL